MRGLGIVQRDLTKLFGSKKPKQKDVFRSARMKAKALAAKHQIEIEKRDGGMNVWAPATLAAPDPFEGDHFADDWSEALAMVTAYARLLGDDGGQRGA